MFANKKKILFRDASHIVANSKRTYPTNYRMVYVAMMLVVLLILLEAGGILELPLQKAQEQFLKGQQSGYATVVGTVVESQKELSYLFIRVDCGVNMYVQLPYGNTKWYPIGTNLSISGELSVPDKQRNPGGFDESAWLKTKKTGLKLQADTIAVAAQSHGIWKSIEVIQQTIELTLYDWLPKSYADLAMALLTGAEHRIEEDLYSMAQQMGIAHIFAVSGLHVGLIGSVLLFCFQQCGLSKSWFAFFLLMLGVMLYCMLAGSPASSVRAAGMILLSAVSLRLYRPIGSINFLAFMAIFLLLENPYYLWSPGFQLSFGVTLSLLLFVSPIRHQLQWIPSNWLRSSIAVVIAAWLGSVPISAWHFYTFSPMAPLCNFFLVPLVSAVLPILFFSIIFCILFPWGSVIWFIPSQVLLFFLQKGTTWMYHFIYDGIGFVQWNIGRPSYFAMLIYLFFLLLLWHEVNDSNRIKSKKAIVTMLAICGILYLCIVPRPPSQDELLYLDVGQGSCALLRTVAGETILFDAGAKKQEVASVLAWYGINHVDAVILSHSDTDHINGLHKVFSTVRVQQMLLETEQMQRDTMTEVLKFAQRKHVTCHAVNKKYSIRLKNHEIIVQPFSDGSDTGNRTELTAVLKYKNGSVVFPGDLALSGVSKFLEEQNTVTIWTVPHHGSRYSGSEQIYQCLKKKGIQYAVISAGKENHYAHPHQEVLFWLEQYQIRYYSTAENGCILFLL